MVDFPRVTQLSGLNQNSQTGLSDHCARKKLQFFFFFSSKQEVRDGGGGGAGRTKMKSMGSRRWGGEWTFSFKPPHYLSHLPSMIAVIILPTKRGQGFIFTSLNAHGIYSI